jgi:choline dehydrogenase-like flavoprotein
VSAAEVIDARRWDGGAVECDVCVVGSGAAGVSVALRLQDRGLSVCVLEAGGTGPDDATTALSDIECTDLAIGRESRNRWFGGSTNTWWGKVAALDAIDLTRRDWVPLSGWPVTEEELARYWRQACELMGLPDLTKVPTSDARGETLLDGERLATKPFFWSRRPLRFAGLYRDRARHGSRVLLHAVVTSIELDATGGRVDRLHVATLGGAHFDVRARATVLAGGGIENPRLLLASNHQQPAGLGNAHDQVGRYFMEHPKGAAGTVAVTPGAPLPARAYWAGRPRDQLKVRFGLRLAEGWQARTGALNSYVLLDPAFTSAGVKALRRVYARKVKGRAALGALMSAGRDIPEVAALLRFKLTNRGRLPGVRVQNFVEQPPVASNRVELADRRDALGVPLPRLHWSVSDAERHTLVLLHRALADELAARGLGTLDSPLLDEGDDWRPTQDASHHMGTTRMGIDPQTSVVDPDGRVHGLANLYVAGSSVFPTSGCANPTLTIVALALRLGDHLGRELAPATLSG